ncbi:MAG: hypothetical protein GJ680_06870 [Alteromonadaceae bacterium]|nr:hypothetical protein [Alteromonadaceae bacterium]
MKPSQIIYFAFLGLLAWPTIAAEKTAISYSVNKFDIDNNGVLDTIECSYEQYQNNADFKGINCTLTVSDDDKKALFKLDLPYVSEVLAQRYEYPNLFVRTFHRNGESEHMFTWDNKYLVDSIWKENKHYNCN